MTDLVVVGGGLGGCFAALTAARLEDAVEVTLVSTAPDRYRHEPGTIDVLGTVENRDGILERPLFGLLKLPDTHPYSVAGKEQVRDALDSFDDIFVDDQTLPYRSGGVKNALVPTLTGTARPTSRYPAGIVSGLVSDQRPMRLIGIEQVPGFDTDLVADRLDDALPYDVSGSTIEFPLDSPELSDYATALDENRETPDGRLVREALVDHIRPTLDIEQRVGLPAMLGLDDHEEIRQTLETQLQAELFEIPVGEPSLPGLRLRNRLFELLDVAGVDRVPAAVEDVETDGDSIVSLALDAGAGGAPVEGAESTAIEGDNFVLATGGVPAGGLIERDGTIREPVFDCPVSHSSSRLDWTENDPLGDHAAARFGVDFSERFKPTDGNDPVYENLYAAGSILGGHNFVEERSRGGVSVVTGYQAAQNALGVE